VAEDGVVEERATAVVGEHEQRRRFSMSSSVRELDVHVRAVVENLRGLPGKLLVALYVVTEVELREVSLDARCDGLRPLRDCLVRVVEPDVAHIWVLRIRRTSPRRNATRRRIERQIVNAAICRENKVCRQVAVLRLD